MPRLHALGAQQVRTSLLLDELARQLFGWQGQDEIIDRRVRFGLDDKIAAVSAGAFEFARRRYRD